MQTLAEFIETHGITMTAEWADANPNMDAGQWLDRASHYKCKFRLGRRQLSTFFSMGSAHTEEPTAADVLDCLASDAASVDSARSFEDWCSDIGYDTDSRKAERTYKACERQAAALKQFVGADYDALLYETERL